MRVIKACTYSDVNIIIIKNDTYNPSKHKINHGVQTYIQLYLGDLYFNLCAVQEL